MNGSGMGMLLTQYTKKRGIPRDKPLRDPPMNKPRIPRAQPTNRVDETPRPNRALLPEPPYCTTRFH